MAQIPNLMAAHLASVALPRSENDMTTLKRSASNTPKPPPPPPRSCVACTDSSIPLIQACRSCNADYCTDCLQDMFIAATADNSRMPPHCCTLIQIHTVLGHLTYDQAKSYRAKFEESITPLKTYCPSPICSAFISEKRVPVMSKAEPATQSLSSILREVLTKVIACPPARFFRGEMDITQLEGYRQTAVVNHPMDLGIIQDRLTASRYKSVDELTKDVQLITKNAMEFNGKSHPVTAAAEELFGQYLLGISSAMNRLIDVAASPSALTLFTCQKCHIGICSTCKQIEHTGSPCDTSIADHEMAMLQTFNYKRCPHCRAGVKKMFGCSHMQCLCGAHWCYYCQKSPEECDGACGDGEFESEDEDDFDSELDEEDLEEQVVPRGRVEERTEPHLNDGVNSEDPNADNRVVNLDVGGERRWAERDYDFGEEPDEQRFSQIWSCKHNFETYETPPEDGIYRGDLSRMECNRCFETVEAVRPPAKAFPPKKRRRTLVPSGARQMITAIYDSVVVVETEKMAWECTRCRLLVCVDCKDKYTAAPNKN